MDCGVAFLMPNRRISIISVCGQNTFWVFILQGFILRLEKKYQIYQYSQENNLLVAAVSSFVILFILSYPWTKNIKQRKIESTKNERKDIPA